MTLEEVNNLVQRIFDQIFDSVTKAEPGGKPLLTPSTTVLSLMKPGMAINARDFRTPWTPGNPNPAGIPAAVNTAMLVDAAPKMSTLYTDSGNSISKIYGDIVNNVQVPKQDPNPAIEQQLQDAYKVLYRTIQVVDPETGQTTNKEVESQLYRDYLDNQTAYFTQRAAYIGAYTEAQKTASGKATWPMLAPTLQIPVKQAYDKWRSNFADKVEQALAIQQTSSQNALSKAFKKAQEVYEGYGVVLDESGSGLAPVTHRSYLLPSDWYSANSASKWTTFDSRAGSFQSNNSSEYYSGGGSAGFSLGIFSIGASAGHSQQFKHMTTETKDLRIQFEYTLVSIRRPWLAFHLLGVPGWNVQNLFAKGKISNGTKINQLNSLMPLLPTSFVVAKNVRISATWSKTDYDFIKKQTQAGGGFGIGPFSISGSYAHSSTKETYAAEFAGNTVGFSGVQIIGWISQVVPYCPPAQM